MAQGLTMQTTRTLFSTFHEPELLGPLLISTALPVPAVDDADALIDRIDRELHASSLWPQPNAQMNSWTHSAWAPAQTLNGERAGTATTIPVEPIRLISQAITPAPTTHLDSSLAEIQSWLGIGLEAACHAAGISRGTVYAWRQRGSSPRPGTVAAIMRIHGLAAAAVKAVGVESAREWFHAGSPSPLTEMANSKGDTARLGALSTRVRRELLRVSVPPPNPLLAATSDDVVR